MYSETVGMGYEWVKSWQGFKDFLGDVASQANRFFNWAGENIGNWWNGYDYEAYNQLSKYEGLFDSKDLTGSIDALINKFDDLKQLLNVQIKYLVLLKILHNRIIFQIYK